MRLLLPSPLPAKATIGIVSPASPQRDAKRLERGIAYLESLGHSVVLGNHVHARYGAYLAGTDAERCADLEQMFADKRIDAIFCARGGYGSARLLDRLDYGLIKRNPKILVGFSDITALQMALLKRTGLVTFSGALPSVDMADGFTPESEEWFWRALTSKRPLGPIQQPWPTRVVQQGAAEGPLIGGNLSVFVTLLGTPYQPPTKGSILVLEDVGEETYSIDRMLNHLRQANVLGTLNGMIAGEWSQSSRPKGSTPHRDVQEVIAEAAEHISGPVLTNMMYGHEPLKLTVPFGVRVRLSSRGSGLRFLEPALRA
jgi:muramoyltetrapeptide carboxypeptidase